jgi:ribonuclease P/MRP protein subunit RPP1
MRRTFCDLHLRAKTKDPIFKQLIIKNAALGFHTIAAPFQSDFLWEDFEVFKKLCQSNELDPVLRVDLRPRTPNELIQQIRRVRRKFEVVCVLCDCKEVSRQAAKDHRVDLLNFPALDFRKRFFDRSEAELACNSLAALEIDMKPLIVLEGPAKIRFLSSVRREVAIAQEFKVPIVLSSGVSELMLLRNPKGLAALAFILGFDECCALDAVSDTPSGIVKRNRLKLDSKFVAPGIRVIKEGKDC